MGYPVPANSPQFVVGGQVYCIASFDNPNPIGVFYQTGVYVRMTNGDWNLAVMNGADGRVVEYTNSGDVLKDMQAKGGRVAYLNWLLTKINDVLAKLFKGAVTPPATEPTTDAEAKAIINAYVLGLKISTTTPPVAG